MTSDIRLIALTGLIALGLAAEAQARGPQAERPTFEQIDADGDGSVTQAELDGFRTGRAAARFAAMDADGDGSVTAAELAAGDAARRADRMIERLNSDGDGALSQAELEAREGRGRHGRGRMHRRGDAHGQMGGHDADRHAAMFARVDADGDGAIDAAEWADMPHRGRTRN